MDNTLRCTLWRVWETGQRSSHKERLCHSKGQSSDINSEASRKPSEEDIPVCRSSFEYSGGLARATTFRPCKGSLRRSRHPRTTRYPQSHEVPVFFSPASIQIPRQPIYLPSSCSVVNRRVFASSPLDSAGTISSQTASP